MQTDDLSYASFELDDGEFFVFQSVNMDNQVCQEIIVPREVALEIAYQILGNLETADFFEDDEDDDSIEEV